MQVQPERRPLQVHVVLFDDVEVLDFAAPFEVLSLAGSRVVPGALEVKAVASKDQIVARNGLVVRPSLVDPAARPDVLVCPGGPGVEPVIANDKALMEWIGAAAAGARWILSVCSGALFLADRGVLRGRSAITHASDLEALQRLDPSIALRVGNRFVRDGNVVTSAGISAGLDASLFLVGEMLGAAVAETTATWLEYTSPDWKLTTTRGTGR
jgi:transcriptional regulator GlxA family with amidase domain